MGKRTLTIKQILKRGWKSADIEKYLGSPEFGHEESPRYDSEKVFLEESKEWFKVKAAAQEIRKAKRRSAKRDAIQKQKVIEGTVLDASRYASLFPLARSLNRRLLFCCGPTNSGKTYEALNHFATASSGCYLAPLRLLALEGQEEIEKRGKHSSLLTGEEKRIVEGSTFTSSTIEMADFQTTVEVAVIDEIQMLADRDRGGHWTAAVVGIPARTVIMCGSHEALKQVRELAQLTGEELEVKEFKRKGSLDFIGPVKLKDLATKTGVAVVAFSRSAVLDLKIRLETMGARASVIYGALGPENRSEEARRFRDGETSILVATDAIGMGLNLPIDELYFSATSKFDGEVERSLHVSEVRQIAGRAGRFSYGGRGKVGVVGDLPLKAGVIKHALVNETQPSSAKIPIAPNWHSVREIAKSIQSSNLTRILGRFSTFSDPGKKFRSQVSESQLALARRLDRTQAPLDLKFDLSLAPVEDKNENLMALYEALIGPVIEDAPVELDITPTQIGHVPASEKELQGFETELKRLNLVSWFSFRYPNHLVVPENSLSQAKSGAIAAIKEGLKASGLAVRRCTSCGTKLAIGSRHRKCDRCFRYSGNRWG